MGRGVRQTIVSFIGGGGGGGRGLVGAARILTIDQLPNTFAKASLYNEQIFRQFIDVIILIIKNGFCG